MTEGRESGPFPGQVNSQEAMPPLIEKKLFHRAFIPAEVWQDVDRLILEAAPTEPVEQQAMRAQITDTFAYIVATALFEQVSPEKQLELVESIGQGAADDEVKMWLSENGITQEAVDKALQNSVEEMRKLLNEPSATEVQL